MNFYKKNISRREVLQVGLTLTAATALSTVIPAFGATDQARHKSVAEFDVLKYGAAGDGKTLDTKAIQEAVNAAAAVGKQSRVIVRTGHKYLIGTIELKGNIEFHLEGNAELLVSTDPADYTAQAAAFISKNADNLTISGTGSVNGRALEFMSHYDKPNEWWIPKDWRPKLFILTSGKNLVIRDITIEKAPSWTVHLMGCEKVLIDNIKINNNLDVPNCDGIDPDHCRDVDIRNCHIICGDDAIVIKTTRQKEDFGPSANIRVSNCILETQDSGVKIGTETTQDIYNIRFEHCKIITSCRGLTVQLRDEGNVYNIVFSDITFVSRYHSDPWWGRGEAISLTAIPRNPGTKVGTLRDVVIRNIQGKAENSVRINGCKESRISNVRLENVAVTLARWTAYAGNLFDNRPTTAYPGIEQHGNPGYYIRFADRVRLKNCSVQWGDNKPVYYTHALEAHDVTGLDLKGFKGVAAFPERDKPIVINHK
jgi:hypothetical protein